MIPEDIQKGGKAVHRLGFTGQIASLATRPKMLRQLETINAVYEYIRLAPTKNKLRQPVDKIQTYNDVSLDSVPLFPSPRRSRDLKTRRRMARERRGAESSVVSMETLYKRCIIGRREE